MKCDRWHLMASQLRGVPAPPAPAIPGRVHRQPPATDDDPGLADVEAAEVWRALARDLLSQAIADAKR